MLIGKAASLRSGWCSMRQRILSADRGMAGIADPRLQQRVSDAVSAFEACLDAAIMRPGKSTIDDLREATNRLMRASARVLIELEQRAGSTH